MTYLLYEQYQPTNAVSDAPTTLLSRAVPQSHDGSPHVGFNKAMLLLSRVRADGEAQDAAALGVRVCD